MWLLRVDCLNESFKKTQKHSSLNQEQVTLPGHYFELTIQKPHQLKSYHLNQESISWADSLNKSIKKTQTQKLLFESVWWIFHWIDQSDYWIKVFNSKMKYFNIILKNKAS